MQNLKQELESLSDKEIQKIANKFDVLGTNKIELIDGVCNKYYDFKKYVSYTYIKQLGREGKDGRTFLVKNDEGNEYAVKIFKKTKKTKSIEREAKLQQIAAEHGLAPKVIEFDGDGKYIVMEKLDVNLYDLFKQQNGQLTVEQQRALVRLFKQLDKRMVFHADPNPPNFMMKDGKWYIIDFGFAKPINDYVVRKYGSTPNMKYMPAGLIMKLRKLYPQTKLAYLEKYNHLNKEPQ